MKQRMTALILVLFLCTIAILPTQANYGITMYAPDGRTLYVPT